MFTRKHFKAIAKIIRENIITDIDNDGHDVKIIVPAMLVDDFCTMFKRDNPNFDRNKFEEAVGIDND